MSVCIMATAKCRILLIICTVIITIVDGGCTLNFDSPRFFLILGISGAVILEIASSPSGDSLRFGRLTCVEYATATGTTRTYSCFFCAEVNSMQNANYQLNIRQTTTEGTFANVLHPRWNTSTPRRFHVKEM